MEKITHKVLALKYRPASFKDLIGQDIMVETITNSIKLNKLPNAYLLTGIRGIGKTTTARLIAKSINCNKDFVKGEKCDSGEFCHCEEISNSKQLFRHDIVVWYYCNMKIKTHTKFRTDICLLLFLG
mgnify:CR=1 FL=1